MIKKAAHSLHLISLLLALAGLAVHAALDGAGLAGSAVETPENLSLAIVVHRLSVGLMLWMMVQPVFGKRVAFAVLGFVALATVGGYLLSKSLPVLEGDTVMAVIQALIIGAIVHSLIHRGHGQNHDGDRR
jgi:FtsH-binding integral membrane protein